jgi:hypothetical protein
MKCMICGKEVKQVQGSPNWQKEWTINAAVVGKGVILKGHRECLENVDNLVVIPARIGIAIMTSFR